MEIQLSRKNILTFGIILLAIVLVVGGYFSWRTWGSNLPAIFGNSQPADNPTAAPDPLNDLAARYVELALTFDYQDPDLMEVNCQEIESMGNGNGEISCSDDITQMAIGMKQFQTVTIDRIEMGEPVLLLGVNYPARMVYVTSVYSRTGTPETTVQSKVTIVFDSSTSQIIKATAQDINP